MGWVPRPSGSGLACKHDRVASTAESPSDDLLRLPAEYMSAVSMKLMPASRAAWMILAPSTWSALPIAPSIIVPRQ